jgi:hypothetical protein
MKSMTLICSRRSLVRAKTTANGLAILTGCAVPAWRLVSGLLNLSRIFRHRDRNRYRAIAFVSILDSDRDSDAHRSERFAGQAKAAPSRRG